MEKNHFLIFLNMHELLFPQENKIKAKYEILSVQKLIIYISKLI